VSKKLIIILLVIQSCFAKAELSLDRTNMWQIRDRYGMTLPYLTHPFLQELQKWQVSNWRVFIWGAGDCPAESTLFWFARKCSSVAYVDWNQGWINELQKVVHRNLKLTKRVFFKCRAIEMAERDDILFGRISVDTKSDFGVNSAYVNAILEDGIKYDCIVIDGHHRNNCVAIALKSIKPGGIIILNNVNQSTIGMNNQKALQLLADYPHYSFLHPGHLDWRTDYWIIN
jgi:hypothetical protein